MVEGYRKYLEMGGVPNPVESREALEEYRRENDPLADWLEERCETAGATSKEREELSDDWRTPTRELHADYQRWKNLRNEKNALGMRGFGRVLTGVGFDTCKVGGERARLGIRLRDAGASNGYDYSEEPFS